MSDGRIKWLLRITFPIAAILIAILCGLSLKGALGVLAITALIMVLTGAFPFLVVGIVFLPILGLYGLKYDSKDEPELDLRDPDTQLFLLLGIPAALGIVALLALNL